MIKHDLEFNHRIQVLVFRIILWNVMYSYMKVYIDQNYNCYFFIISANSF
jgi:hypothetical protein